jgi:hypothetical protein
LGIIGTPPEISTLIIQQNSDPFLDKSREGSLI